MLQLVRTEQQKRMCSQVYILSTELFTKYIANEETFLKKKFEKYH